MLKEGGTQVFSGKRIFLVGIKGTGMSALAELLADSGADVTGSDTSEKFYTDEILDRSGKKITKKSVDEIMGSF